MTDNPIEAGAAAISGVRLGTACAHIRYPERRDLVLIELTSGPQHPASVAGVFTRNAFCAAPVIVAKRHLGQNPTPRYLLINTGNANAGTGVQGLNDAEQSCALVAALTGCEPYQVLPFSTGVIGERLPMDRIEAGIAQAHGALSENGWNDAAWGILTTDTRPKLRSRQVMLGDHPVTLTGMAKGSGMIYPNMATMLAFVATDAVIDQALLKRCLHNAVADSFNAITVDGDTSTNDACMLLASGRSGVVVDANNEHKFCQALAEFCQALAKDMVRDAEGATKFITIAVEQGRDRDECRVLAYTIAHSPLVKTAFFASDPNWGRILAAVGRAGLAELALNRIDIFLDEVAIITAGERAADYTEARGQRVMDRAEITVRVVLRRGDAQACVWTSDLSHDYVRINADYRS